MHIEDITLPYNIIGKEAFKLTPKGELLKKKKELATEEKLEGDDRNPNKIVRLKKEINDLTEQIEGKPEDKEKEKKEKEKRIEVQKKKMEERRKSPDFLRVVIRKTDKDEDLEEKKEELKKEEAQKGQNKNPKKIERLKKEVDKLEEAEAEAEAELDDKVEDSAGTRAHVNIINNAIAKEDVWAIIEFSANYDHEMLKKKDAGGPVEFKYQKYLNTFKGKGWKKTVKYDREESVTSDGEFKGDATSTLELDGKPTSSKDELKVKLDKYVEEHMVKEGLMPYGRSVVDPTKQVGFDVKYKNTKLNKTYYDEDHFLLEYDRLLIEDAPQLKRKDIHEEKKTKSGIGQSTLNEINQTIKFFKQEETKDPENAEIRGKMRTLEKMKKQVEEFDVTQEVLNSINSTREWLLKEKKEDLEEIREEVRQLRAAPPQERDESKVRLLSRQERNIERAVKQLTEAMEEAKKKEEEIKKTEGKKSYLISIATHIRDVLAVSKEWVDLSREIQKTEDELKHLETQKKKIKEKGQVGLIRDRKNKLTDKETDDLKELKELRKKDDPSKEDKAQMDKLMGNKNLKEIIDLEGKKYREYPDLVEKLYKEKTQALEDLKKKQKETKGPGAFPETEDGAVQQFYDVFTNAGVKSIPKMTLFGWLTPEQIKRSVQHLQTALRTIYEKKIEELGKDKNNQDKIRELQKEHKAELAKAREGIKALPEDLKKRRDKFKEESPSDFPRLKEPDWVDNEKKVEEVLKKVDAELHDIKKKEKTVRQPVVNLIEKTKFKGIGKFLKVNKRGLGKIAGDFLEAPLEAGEANLKPFKTYLEKAQGDYDSAKALVGKMDKALKGIDPDPKLLEEAKKNKKEFDAAEKALSGAKNIVEHYKTEAKRVPALGYAKALLGNLAYFSSLFNYYSSILYYGDKEVLPTTAPERKTAGQFTEDDKRDLKKIREDAVEALERVASAKLYMKDRVKRAVAKAKEELELFIDGYSNYEMPKEPQRQPAKTQLEREREQPRRPEGERQLPAPPSQKKVLEHDEEGRQATLPYEVITDVQVTLPYEIITGAEEKEEKKESLPPMSKGKREQKKKEMYFPGDLRIEVSDLIKDVEKKDPNKADEARSFLKKLEKECKKRYEISLEKGVLDKLFKEIKVEGKSKKDFEQFKYRFVDRVNRRIINDFIDTLDRFVKGERPRKKESPYLNKKDPKKYEKMWKYVNNEVSNGNLPKLSKEPTEPEETGKNWLTMGEPTRGNIREYYEKAFEKKELPVSDETRKQMEEIFIKADPIERRGKGEGGDLPKGGGGAKSKGRPKPVKDPIPSAAYSLMKENLAEKINKLPNGNEVINKMLGFAVAKLKGDPRTEDMYIGKIVDGLVNYLKHTLFYMSKLNVDTSKIDIRPRPEAEKGGLPIQEQPGQSKGGKPSEHGARGDIILTEANADDIYDKMIQMIKTVNKNFIAPDTANVPPADASKLKPGQYYLPTGLVNYFAGPKKKEKEKGALPHWHKDYVPPEKEKEKGKEKPLSPEEKRYLEREEKKKEEAEKRLKYKVGPSEGRASSERSLAFKLALNFVNTDIRSVDELTEEDLVDIN